MLLARERTRERNAKCEPNPQAETTVVSALPVSHSDRQHHFLHCKIRVSDLGSRSSQTQGGRVGAELHPFLVGIGKSPWKSGSIANVEVWY